MKNDESFEKLGYWKGPNEWNRDVTAKDMEDYEFRIRLLKPDERKLYCYTGEDGKIVYPLYAAKVRVKSLFRKVNGGAVPGRYPVHFGSDPAELDEMMLNDVD